MPLSPYACLMPLDLLAGCAQPGSNGMRNSQHYWSSSLSIHLNLTTRSLLPHSLASAMIRTGIHKLKFMINGKSSQGAILAVSRYNYCRPVMQHAFLMLICSSVCWIGKQVHLLLHHG